MSEQLDVENQDGSTSVPGWVGARSAWGLLAAALVCLSSLLVLGHSMSDGVLAILIGLMMGLGLIAASAGFVWFRSARLMNDSTSQRLGAGITVVGGLLLFALPLLAYLYAVLFFEGQ